MVDPTSVIWEGLVVDVEELVHGRRTLFVINRAVVIFFLLINLLNF